MTATSDDTAPGTVTLEVDHRKRPVVRVLWSGGERVYRERPIVLPEATENEAGAGLYCSGGKGTAGTKIEAMTAAGITVTNSPASLGTTLAQLLKGYARDRD